MATTTTDLEACLRERFALDRFRPGQREVIQTVLAGQDCLCVMPTGGGKSLCYQLPSLLLEGVTLVVSPLIALMKDQVDALVARGLRATFINSSLDTTTQNERIAATERGEYDLVYVAPERFRSGRFREVIGRTRVALLAVDEAHCISEWGHDFRPDYTRLGLARGRLGNPTTIALTATATDHVRRDICEQLALADPRVFITGFDRPNLRYEVSYAPGDASKQEVLVEILSQSPGAGIIYCATRKRCDEVAEFLRDEAGRKCVVYHAGLQGEERRRAQEQFMASRDLVVIATNAFGMGVDKSDIRFVIHYNMPGTIEAYYQEAGRAGRDGLESRCVLLFAPTDRYIQEFFIEGEYPSREVVGLIYQFLAAQDVDPIELTQAEIKERLALPISDIGVGGSLKLLERAGALERLRPRENMAIVRIDSEVSLVGLLPPQATVQRKVLSALERLVAAASGDDTYFSPHQLARRLELEPPQLSRAIHELCDKLPIEYVPPFRGNAVRMIDRQRTSDTLGIDFEVLEERKAHEYQKLEQVIAYARSSQCRRRVILDYFGDRSPVQCGHCDNCFIRRTAATATPEPSEQATEIVRKILSGIARTKGRFGKTTVAGMLTGSKSEATKRWRLDKLSTYGLLADFTQPEVVQLIDNLIAAGWVTQEDVEKFRPVISVSAIGWEVMTGEQDADCTWRLPEYLLAKLRRGGLEPSGRTTPQPQKPAVGVQAAPDSKEAYKPLDRALLGRLRQARDKWADEARLPPYMVLTNAAIEDLARVKPASQEDLLAIKGIGPAKVARYGLRLLEIVTGRTDAVPRAESSAPSPKHPAATEPPARQRHQPLPPLYVRASEIEPHPTSAATQAPTASHVPPTYFWTWRLLERGFTQTECALARGLDESTVLQHALEAARAGHSVPLDAFLTLDQIGSLVALVGDEPPDGLAVPSDQLPDGVRSEHVELYLLAHKQPS